MIKSLTYEDTIHTDHESIKMKWNNASYFGLIDEDLLDGTIDSIIHIIQYSEILRTVHDDNFHYFRRRYNGNIKAQMSKYIQIPQYINPYEDICCICLEHFTTSKNSIITQCGHKYHKSCIVQLYQNNILDCSMCKDINSIDSAMYILTECITYNESKNQKIDKYKSLKTLSLLFEYEIFNLKYLLIDSVINFKNKCENPNHMYSIKYRNCCNKCNKYIYS